MTAAHAERSALGAVLATISSEDGATLRGIIAGRMCSCGERSKARACLWRLRRTYPELLDALLDETFELLTGRLERLRGRLPHERGDIP